MLAAVAARQLAVLLALAACRDDPRAPSRAAGDGAPVADPAPDPADPLAEASLIADIEWLTAAPRAGRGSEAAGARDTARWLVAELEQAGYAPATMPIPGADDQVNVIAALPPRDRAAPTVLVTAHYDHLGVVDGSVHPGADDNASGVAVALAVARDLAARRDVAGKVVFAFLGAEEIGLLGARAYVAAPPHPLASTRAVYNLDMVGRRFFESLLDLDATLGSVGLPTEGPLHDAARAAAEDAGLEVVAVSPELLEMVGEDRRSDDWVFRDAGVTAVHFSTGLHDDYHQPTDTPDRLSRPQLVRIARFLRGLVAGTAR
jgi:Zn-dependent M28 family amino/carboxypeptidase